MFCLGYVCLQGHLVYESDGIYPADHFFSVNRSDCTVTVSDSLKIDPLSLSQYQVVSSGVIRLFLMVVFPVLFLLCIYYLLLYHFTSLLLVSFFLLCLAIFYFQVFCNAIIHSTVSIMLTGVAWCGEHYFYHDLNGSFNDLQADRHGVWKYMIG